MLNRQQYPLVESSGMGSEPIRKWSRKVLRIRSMRLAIAMNSGDFLAEFGMTPLAWANVRSRPQA